MHIILRRVFWLSANSKKLGNTQSGFLLTRENLAKLKQKAVRKGCWYKSLKHSERTLLDLTMRVVEKVQSFVLAKVVSRLVSRLFEAMESHIYRLIRTEGEEMAKKISKVAQKLGYRAARKWAKDKGFMQFLVINNLEVLGR